MRQAKFAAVGLLNSLVDFVVFNFLTALLGMPVIPASVLAYCSGILNSYIFNLNWTFADVEAKSDKTIVAVVSNYLLDITTWDQGWVFAVSKVIATTGALFANFTLMHRWVFVSAR